MKNIIEEIDDNLKHFLQCDLEFCLNEKVIKRGKLLLFDHGYFNYIFHIQTNSKKTSIKTPVPFEFYMLDEILHFDYTLDSFTNKIPMLEETVSKIKIEQPSKFFDNILKIKAV